MSAAVSTFFDDNTSGRELLDAVRRGVPKLYASGIKGSAAAFSVSLLFDTLRRHICIITPTLDDARELHSELLFFRDHGDNGNLNESELLLFPPLDTRPYEQVLGHCDVSAQRLWALYRLCATDAPVITITCVRALFQRVLPPEALIDACHEIIVGDQIDRDTLLRQLIESGYTRVSMVEDRGDVSVRGEIIDLFPPGYARPVRIDLFGDTVESMRIFDSQTQRSCAEVQRLHIVPVREIILSPAVLRGIEERSGAEPLATLAGSAKGRAFLDGLHSGFLPAGADYCLPLIYPRSAALPEYLPERSLAVWFEPDEAQRSIAALEHDVRTYFSAAQDERRVASSPEEVFLPFDTPEEMPVCEQTLIFEGWAPQRPEPQVLFATQANDDIRSELLAADSRSGVLTALAGRMEHWFGDGVRVFVVCHTKSQCERLAELFADYGLTASVTHDRPFSALVEDPPSEAIELFVGKLARGFRSQAYRFAVLTEEEIFGEKKRRKSAPRLRSGTAISDFSDLKRGDYVVHRDNGIGIYHGLETLDAGGVRADYLRLEYLGGDRLYLPVDRINLINKYECADDAPPKLDRLGGTSWLRTKRKVKESVEKVARELIELYSARKVYRGHAFAAPDHYYHEFEASFPYEETPDQLAAIQDVLNDMSSDLPMDRLICGDVGYGKTEVALRAAFRAVMEGKQAAVFVPTTILAQQHYQTFRERFSQYPVRVDILSRFRSAKDQRQIVADLAAGKIDIIIGTHRLVSKDIVFKDLGLLVIDEEHRFGVKHKEKIKQLKRMVDVMTLTATPIPRTLQMSLFGIRDFSTIETPPEDRLSIRTVISHFDEGLIRDALMPELNLVGQVFFVHDRVRSIEPMAMYLRRLVPEMQLGVAHGQMNERQLERVMMQFVRGEVNVLLCTTIIESGLDFPTANTILINNAHRLGLAQMYQLRGRVGRGKVRAYAYMLVPGKTIVSREAAKRLEALTEFTELGSGYRLATRDLQIRGAGNILGHAQSGHMTAVGVDMYLELLGQAISGLKGEQARPKIDPEVNLNLQAYIPDDYVADVNQRLVLYRRIASVLSDDESRDIEEEIRDRYGSLPEQVEMLLDISRIRNMLRELLIVSVDFYKQQLVFTFHADAADQLDRIMHIVDRDSARYRFTPDLKLFAKTAADRPLLPEIRAILE